MNELEGFAAGVHGAASVLHARAALTGKLSDEARGVARGYHALGLAYNAMRGQWFDVAAHLIGIFAKRRVTHALVAIYDGKAAAIHGSRAL